MAVAIYRDMDRPHEEARAAIGVGACLTHLGRPERAIAVLKDTLPLLEPSGPSKPAAEVALQLSATFYGIGDYDSCAEMARRASEIADLLGDKAIRIGRRKLPG